MPEPPIIAPWIIEKIRKREKEEREKRRDQPQPQLPIPEAPRLPPKEHDPDDGNRRGVVIIEPGDDGAPDLNETLSFIL